MDKARGKTAANQFQIHQMEAGNRPPNRHPERRGQWLIPDFDQIKSLDEMARALGLNDLQRYQAICGLLNKHHQIQNPD
jgi:hypothetical protein